MIKIEKKVSEMDITLKNLDGYQKRNNNSIELEVTKAVFENLKENEKSLYIIDVSSIFPKKYKNEKNSIFIEIDGLILGTNDRDYASKYNKSLIPRVKENEYEGFELSQNLLPKIYKLYIIEGKHNITKQKVIDKYEKYNKFKTFLNDIRNQKNNFKGKFKKIIDDYKLYLFDPLNVTLIFGTPMWNEDAKKQINQYMKTDSSIKMISLSGNRYEF